MPMEREMQAMIGQRLRARYAEILAEPIPGKFLDLLDRLDQAELDRGVTASPARRRPNPPEGPGLMQDPGR